MKKETLEYLNGARNATRDEFIVGREKAGNAELIFVSLPETQKPLYALWNSKKLAEKFTIKSDPVEMVKFELVSPKGTGGKEVYVSLMLAALDELNERKLSLLSAGAMLKLSSYIEWNTGRVCRKRDGKPLTRKMMSEIFNIGISKTKAIIRELSRLEVLHYDKKRQAYFFNTKYIRKGAISHEDKI